MTNDNFIEELKSNGFHLDSYCLEKDRYFKCIELAELRIYISEYHCFDKATHELIDIKLGIDLPYLSKKPTAEQKPLLIKSLIEYLGDFGVTDFDIAFDGVVSAKLNKSVINNYNFFDSLKVFIEVNKPFFDDACFL